MNKGLIVVPTYQEREALPTFLAAARGLAEEFDVLIVDDGSPDGTGALADEAATCDAQIHVLHRTAKDSLGAAYRAGFAWALERDYAVVVQMDVDLSHPPTALAGMREAAVRGAGLVIGTRYLPGGGTEGWPLARRVISRIGCAAASRALRLPYSDLSGGFKLWTAEALRQIDVATTLSTGYVFQIETTQRAHRAGVSVVELPFVFRDRVAGTSKMEPAIALEGARIVARLRRDPWHPRAA